MAFNDLRKITPSFLRFKIIDVTLPRQQAVSAQIQPTSSPHPAHIRPTSVPHPAHIRPTSVPHPARIRPTSGPHPVHICPASVPHLAHICPASGPHLSRICPASGPHPARIWPTSVPHPAHICPTSVPHGFHTGQMWAGSGPKLCCCLGSFIKSVWSETCDRCGIQSPTMHLTWALLGLLLNSLFDPPSRNFYT